MKINYTLLVLCLSFSLLSFSQQLPIDFSENSDSFIPFFNSDFSLNMDPEDANNTVGQFFNDGSSPWQGFYLDLSQAVDLDSDQTMTMSFYAFDPDAHTIILKLEDGNNPDVEVERTISSVGWTNNITFDFANAVISGTSNSVSASGDYNRMVIFIDGGMTIPGTYLIDDINGESSTTDPNELDVIYTDLVWEDNFDTDGAVNSNNWYHQTQLPAGGSWFNGEQQHYTNRIENSFVDDGFLNIVAIKENFTDQGETKQYTSARLNSKFAFTYGRVDVRAKLPFGDGTWPAIWTLGKNTNEDGAYWQTQGFGTTNWPASGEIDIMEHGLGAINHVSSALHTPSSFGNTMNFQSYVLNDVANEFHVYSVNWSPNQITFLIDGIGFYTYNPTVKDDSTWPFDLDQYLLLNIAMGGVSGDIDPNFDQSSMIIDYVKVYQNTGLSIDEVFANTISVYPNPVSNVIVINTNETIAKLELYNSLGQLIITKGQQTTELNVQGLKAGIYLLKIYSGSRLATKKVIIK